MAPTHSITLADTTLTVGETTRITINFFEDSINDLEAENLHSPHGTFSDLRNENEGMSWSALFTPNPGESTSSSVITLDSSVLGGASSNPFTIDTQPPTVTVVVADNALTGNETSLVTITFNEQVRNFGIADITADNGTVTNLVSSDEGTTWTALFTPDAGVIEANNVISVNTQTLNDVLGNVGENAVVASNNYSVNTGPSGPTATVQIDDTALKIGETTSVTVTFSEQVDGFDSSDVSVANGTVDAMTSSDGGVTWTGTVTPNGNVQNSVNAVTVNLAGVTGHVSEAAGTGTATSNNYAIDTRAPTATIVVADNNLTTGETSLVTVTFSEAVTGFVLGDLSAQNGSLSNLSTSDNITYTATFTPNAGVNSLGNVVTLANNSVSDGFGNGNGSAVTSNTYNVRTKPPTVTVSINDTALKTGETPTVTFAFSEDVSGFGTEDVNVGSGSLGTITRVGSSNTFTALLTPTSGVETTNNNVLVNMAGVTSYNTGIAGVGTAVSQIYSVDTKAPTATITLADPALRIGETSQVSIVFSEAVQGLELTDFTANGGELSNLVSSNGGASWSATFTPDADFQAGYQNIYLHNTGVQDLAGNAGVGTTPSATYAIDTKAPTATISVADNALKMNETSQVSIVFSEAVQDLDINDFTVNGGMLSNLVNDEGSSASWTATFTPTAGLEAGNQHITLNNSGVHDTAGNAVAGITESNTYAIDTKAPTVGISISDDNVSLNETATVTVTFSERMGNLDAERVTAENGTLSSFTSADEGLTWTATFTPDATVAQGQGYSRLDFNAAGLSDAAGNDAYVNSSGYYQVNAAGPTATVTLEDSALKSGENTAVTITFSERVRDFDASDVSVGSGTLNGLTSDDEGLTWHGTLTPTAGVEDYSNVVSVNLAGVTGSSSGFSGIGNALSANYTVDTKAPTATIVVADGSLTAGETSLVTITFSEPVRSFNSIYLNAENATLGTLSTSDEGTTWTTTLTPRADVNDSSNVVSLLASAMMDLAGNLGSGVTTSNNYAVNTAPPVVVTPKPTPSTTVDGVPVKQTTGTAADGSKTQVISVPTVTSGRVEQDNTSALADIPLVKSAAGDKLLSVGVPVGFGVQATGSTTAKAASDSLTNLIAEIKAHSTNGSAAQESMVGGGAGFLGTLDKAPLLVQTIVVTAPGSTDVSKGALVVSGNAGANTPQTALVIDTKGLPAGATIELQNVDFAAIIGAVSLRGGEGKQVIFGDNASQNIFLGADDDILHGGAGNDIVGSAGGNDQIFGDEGDDIVFGGEGNDLIDGGTGYDIVKLAGASRAEYSFRVNDGKLVMTHLDGGSDGADIVSNVEALRFAGVSSDVAFRDTDVASLVRMYDTIFGRNPDQDGLNFWIARSEEGVSLHDIAVAMATSTEAKAHYQGVSDADFIGMLYLQGLDRTGTAAESKIWIDSLEAGVVTRGDALLGFADSAEKIALVGFMDTSVVTA